MKLKEEIKEHIRDSRGAQIFGILDALLSLSLAAEKSLYKAGNRKADRA